MTETSLPDPDSTVASPWEAFGVREQSLLPDEDAPPVDNTLVADLVSGQLDPATADCVHLLVGRFRPWRAAFARALRESAEPTVAGKGITAEAAQRDWERSLDWLIGTARGLVEVSVSDTDDRSRLVSVFDGYRRAVRDGRTARHEPGQSLWRTLIDLAFGTAVESVPRAADHTTIGTSHMAGDTLSDGRPIPAPAFPDDVEAARRFAAEVLRCLKASDAWQDAPLLGRIFHLNLQLHAPNAVSGLVDEPEDLVAAGRTLIDERLAAGTSAEVSRG